jgi:hypothetical protein
LVTFADIISVVIDALDRKVQKTDRKINEGLDKFVDFGERIDAAFGTGDYNDKSSEERMERVLQSEIPMVYSKENYEYDNKYKTEAEYGDIIGVCRTGYEHYGVYVNDDCIIHFASRNSDFGNQVIHETNLRGFLRGDEDYFVLNFPKVYGKPRKIERSEIFLNMPSNYIEIMKEMKYRLYRPEETVERARSKMGSKGYNLLFNNCEHFAIWCKTGIHESHQVNGLLGGTKKIYI